MKIISLQSENVKRLKAVRIEPDGSMVVIGGKNAQGKSSVLDSIVMALGGKKAVPPKPVREGQDEALVVCELDELVVTRKFKPDGRSSLTVETKDGAAYKKPQAILDALVGQLSFDPLGFSRMDAKPQLELLQKLVGVDFTQQDAKRAELFEERAGVNRTTKRLQGQLEGLPYHADAPKEQASVAELVRLLEEAQGEHRKAKLSVADVDERKNRIVADREGLAKLEADLKRAEQAIKAHGQRYQQNQEELKDAEALAESLSKKLPDVEAAREKLNSCEANNQKLRDNQHSDEVERELKGSIEHGVALSSKIIAIADAKAKTVADANFPVPGLSFGDDGVIFNGVPFQQASSAEQLRASVAIGLAMNPKLPVLLVHDGSLLDEASLKLLGELAEEAGAQVWVERVSEGDECSLIIEDGEVRP